MFPYRQGLMALIVEMIRYDIIAPALMRLGDFLVLLKKAGAGHFTENAPGFLSRFHWRFLAKNLIFYGYQNKACIQIRRGFLL